MLPILIKDLGTKFTKPTDKRKRHYGLYECECGELFECLTDSIDGGKQKSCGCKRKSASRQRMLKHGKTGENIYNRWLAIKSRCYNENNHAYKNYGGRGIKLCNEWFDFNVFYEWSINNGYKEHLSIDRINNNGNYSPDNCRWVDSFVQAQNKRMRQKNTSGATGISIRNGRYIARIQHNGTRHHLGSFNTMDDARNAYNRFILENNTHHNTT